MKNINIFYRTAIGFILAIGVLSSLQVFGENKTPLQCQSQQQGSARLEYATTIGFELNDMLEIVGRTSKTTPSSSFVALYLEKAFCFREVDGMLVYFEDFAPFYKKTKSNKQFKKILEEALLQLKPDVRDSVKELLKDLDKPLEE